MNNDFSIEAASAKDEAAILSFLTKTELPPEGVSEHLGGFLIGRDVTGRDRRVCRGRTS
ncbi:MAG TPA: hypothetical protein PKY82_08610 [Pyrinomonadaceae bacterium]|nr:hypothetical protein [Pyrinomonadaceae bacterium]